MKLHSLRARSRRGVTLVEVLIVVAIMSVIAGVATITVWPQWRRANVENAKLGAQAVHEAASLYQEVDADDDTCPAVEDLVTAKKLEASKTNDPWQSRYRLDCGQSDPLRVYSNGRDLRRDTADDVRDDFTKEDIRRVADL